MTEQNHYIPQEEESFDLRKWIGKILVNWYWFVLSVVILGGASWIYTKYLVRTYRVESTILVKDEKGDVGAEILFNEFNFGSSGWYMDNELLLLKSWALARRTLDQLNFDISYVAVGRWSENPIYGNIPFRVVTGGDKNSYINVPIHIKILSDSTYQCKISGRYRVDTTFKFHEPFTHKEISFILSPNPHFNIYAIPEVVRTNEYYFKLNDLDQLAYRYRNKLSAEWVSQSGSVIRLSTTGFSAQMEVDYLNALMDEYLKWGLEEKNRIAKNTVDFIDDQLSGMADSLQIAEQDLSSFRADNRVISLSSEAQSIKSRLEQQAQEKALIDMRITYYEYLMEALTDSEDFSEIMGPAAMGVSNEELSGLIGKLRELSQRKANMEFSVTENFQQLTRIKLEIESYREDLKQTVQSILKTATDKQREIERRTSQLNSEIRKLPATEAKLLNMQRQFEMREGLFNFLSQKRAEAAIAMASNTPDQVIFDEARTDGVVKVSPNNYRNYAMGVAIGILLPLLIIILVEVLKTSIQEREDVEKRTRIPIIGTIGRLKKNGKFPVLTKSRSLLAESFRAIRTDLQFLLYKDDKKVIMVTSTVAREGKSFVAMNLAGIFSVTDKKAVVVGLDLRKPVLHKEINISNKEGVSTYIIGKSDLDDIIYESEHENLFFIPAGPIAPNPAELLQTSQFTRFLDSLKARFDIIILDTPPVSLVTDASLVAQHSDAILYVIRQSFTKKNALTFINQLAEKPHFKNMSIVLNDVVIPRYYGYKYSYGYGKGSSGGYYEDK